MKCVFVYNAFGKEKCPFWKDINVNMYLGENHFERFPFYTILEKKIDWDGWNECLVYKIWNGNEWNECLFTMHLEWKWIDCVFR